MRTKSVLFTIFCLILFASLYLRNSVSAHITSLNHMVCGYSITPDVDIIHTNIATHKKPAGTPTGVKDEYPYNNPDNWPTLWPGTAVDSPLYAVISQPPQSIYQPKQYFFGDDPTLSCNYALTCKASCDLPITSGTCDDTCNLTLQGGQCAQYGGNSGFTVKTGGNATTIMWGDNTPNTTLLGTPTTQSVGHIYSNPGKYDILTNCGGPICHKRYHVVCQPGGGVFTPTPLPTATPTPTGVYACITPLVCSHPCACNPSSSSYVSASTADVGGGCQAPNSTSNFKGGYGSAQGTTDGAACAPGLVCCQPPAASSAWFKTKNASYHEQGALSNSIPSSPAAFNGSDTGLCVRTNPGSLACHGINFPGLVSAEGNISLGSGVTNFNVWGYGDVGYNYTSEFTPDTLIQYMRARKETVTITDPENVQTNKVNYIAGTQVVLEIDNNGMQGNSPFVLLIDNGHLRFDVSTQFNPSNSPMAIIVDGTIQIKSTIKEMNGIFIANDFDFAYDIQSGSYATDDLWINGNVMSMNDANCLAKRKRADNTKPTCFFTHDFVNQYLPLINLFSTRTFSRSSN